MSNVFLNDVINDLQKYEEIKILNPARLSINWVLYAKTFNDINNHDQPILA